MRQQYLHRPDTYLHAVAGRVGPVARGAQHAWKHEPQQRGRVGTTPATPAVCRAATGAPASHWRTHVRTVAAALRRQRTRPARPQT